MNQIRLEALRLAAACGGDSHQQVERAEAFVRFLEEGGRSTEDGLANSPHPYLPLDGVVEDEARGAAPKQSLHQVINDARRLLVRHIGLCGAPVTLEDFLRAGMPEWMAQAAIAAMRQDVGEERFINADERRKDWAYFAHRYFNLAEQLRAPDNNRYP